jgi:Protein of unknown function (DUF4054)
MIVPTAVNMKFKFPEFAGIADATIEFAIEEAVIACGSSMADHGEWVDEANQTLAMMYYAAHLMQVSLMRATSGGTGQIVSSERTPDLSVTYSVPDQSKAIDFTMTIYGERFLGLVNKNFPAILTVGSAIRM